MSGTPRLCKCGEMTFTIFTNEDVRNTSLSASDSQTHVVSIVGTTEQSPQLPRFSHTLSSSMSVSWNPGSQTQLCELTPSTHVPRGPHVCAYGNLYHFCTDGRGKFSLASQWSCLSHRITCITGNTLAVRSRPGPTLAPLPC